MSVLSNLLKKIVPPAAVESPVAEVGAAFLDRYVGLARAQGEAALGRALALPQADLVRIAPHADPAALAAAEAELVRAESRMILLVAGVPE